MRRQRQKSGRPSGIPLAHDPARRIAIRTHVEPEAWRPLRLITNRLWPSLSLLVHTVPVEEPGEPLRFAVWRLIETNHWTSVEQGLVVGAGLEESARAELEKRAAAVGIPTSHIVEQPSVGDLIFRVCYQRRAALVAWDLGVEVGRLATDWGRSTRGRTRNGLSLVIATTPGRVTDRQPELRNGETENVFRPRIQLLSLGEGRNLTNYSQPLNLDDRDRNGSRSMVSLKPMAEALSGSQVHTPAEAAELWEITADLRSGPDTDLDAALDRVDMIGKVARALFEDHARVQPAPPGTATSPGTYARGYLERIGLNPPLVQNHNFPRSVLAASMGAYFAGDVFTRARSRRLPIHKLDLGSAYSVAYHLTDSWRLYSAQAIAVTSRDPAHVTAYVELLNKRIRRWWSGAAIKPLTQRDWRRLARTIVWVLPDGDILPQRPRQAGWKNQGAQMVVGPLTSHRALPYFLSDVLVSALRTGKVPAITRAIHLTPRGQQNLRPVNLPTGRLVDPNVDDPVFALAVERLRIHQDTTLSPQTQDRMRGLLKGMAVAACSGLPIQVLDDEPSSKPKPILTWDPLDLDSVDADLTMSDIVERPGTFYFPPVGGGVTSSARLLLHLCRGAFEAMGGTVAYWDTDSLFVVATPFGGEIIPLDGGGVTTEDGRSGVRAISVREVLGVQWKVEKALSPYPPELRPYTYDQTSDVPVRVQLPALLKSEPENQPPPQTSGLEVEGPFYDGNRPKRSRTYHIIRPGSHVEIRDGLPVVVPPTEDETRTLSRVVVTNPSLHGVTYRPPAGGPDNYAEILMSRHLEEHLQIGTGARPEWGDDIAVSVVPATRMEAIALHPDNRPYSRIKVATSLFGQQLVAAYPADDWRDIQAGRPATFAVTLEGDLDLAYQVPRSIDFQIRRITTAPPTNALTHDKQPVGPRTEGLLEPAPTRVTAVDLTGKESRRWGDGRGTLTPPHINLYLTRTDPQGVVDLIRKHYWWPGAAELVAGKTGLSVRTIRNILAGKRPSPRTTERLWEFAYQPGLFMQEEPSRLI